MFTHISLFLSIIMTLDSNVSLELKAPEDRLCTAVTATGCVNHFDGRSRVHITSVYTLTWQIVGVFPTGNLLMFLSFHELQHHMLLCYGVEVEYNEVNEKRPTWWEITVLNRTCISSIFTSDDPVPDYATLS
ncbi:hypothetical protein P879_11594, partial [Paragonimus westermani]